MEKMKTKNYTMFPFLGNGIWGGQGLAFAIEFFLFIQIHACKYLL